LNKEYGTSMANVAKMSPEEKKALILDTCKELFYEKGYNETSYEDIYTAAGLPPGSVTYYFTGKKNIAESIHAEYELKVKTVLSLLIAEEYELRVMSALEILNWWNVFFINPNIRRFIVELGREGVLRRSFLGNTEHFFKLHINEYSLMIEETKFKLITTAYIGMITELLFEMHENFSAYTAEEVADFVIENAYKFLNVDPVAISDAIGKAHVIYNEVKINCEFFKNFKYDERLL